MSIAFQRNNHSTTTIERSGLACVPIYSGAVNRRIAAEEDPSSSSSSSIGRDSDESSDTGGSGDGDAEEEVQSASKDGALGSLEGLEEVLPMKRGISNFYAGKSKSFSSLTDAASCSSVKDIVKPENAYTRKRKNLIAYNSLWGKNHNSIPRGNIGGFSKRPTNSRSAMCLEAVAVTSSSDNNSSSECLNSNSSSPSSCLPPLPPHVRRTHDSEIPSTSPGPKFPQLRSLSLSDLQVAAATPSIAAIFSNIDQ